MWSRISNTPSVFRLSSRFGSDDARCTTIRMPRSTLDSPGGVYVFLILRDSSLVRQTEKKKKTRRRVESSIRLWLHDTIRILSIYLLLCQYLGFSARRSAKIKATRKRGVCGGETPTERGRDGSTRRRIIIIIIISITLLENERKRRSRNQEFQFLSFLFTSHYIYVH